MLPFQRNVNAPSRDSTAPALTASPDKAAKVFNISCGAGNDGELSATMLNSNWLFFVESSFIAT